MVEARRLAVGYLVPQGEKDGRPRARYLSTEQFHRALASAHLDQRSTHLPLDRARLCRAYAVYEPQAKA